MTNISSVRQNWEGSPTKIPCTATHFASRDPDQVTPQAGLKSVVYNNFILFSDLRKSSTSQPILATNPWNIFYVTPLNSNLTTPFGLDGWSSTILPSAPLPLRIILPNADGTKRDYWKGTWPVRTQANRPKPAK